MSTKDNQEDTSDDNVISQLPPTKMHWMMFIIFAYTIFYSIFGLWLLFDGYLNGFSSIYWLWNIESTEGIPAIFQLSLFSLIGAILGCGTLDVASFHKYIAIEKEFDLDHSWGFFFSPILAAIVGLIVFALFQSGLLIFAGSLSTESSPITAKLGFTAIGFLSGFSWHDVLLKLTDISKGLFKKSTPSSRKHAPQINNQDKDNSIGD